MTLRTLTNPGPAAVAHGRPNGWQRAVNCVPGIALTGALAALAIEFGKVAWLQANGISALTLAIVLGMLVGNTVYPYIASATAGGVMFSKQTLLRAGIILYGLRLTFQDIANVGVAGSGHRRRRAEQYLRTVLVGGHADLRPGSKDGYAHRRRQFDLRRRGGDGHRTGGARPRRASHRGRLDRGRLRYPGYFPVSGHVPLERALPPARDVADRLWNLRRLDDSRSGAGGCGGEGDYRCRRQYRGHHQDGARHDAGALPDHPVHLFGARTRRRRRRRRHRAMYRRLESRSARGAS